MSGLAGVVDGEVGNLVLVWLRRGYLSFSRLLAKGCREPGDGSARGAVEGLGNLRWSGCGWGTRLSPGSLPRVAGDQVLGLVVCGCG